MGYHAYHQPPKYGGWPGLHPCEGCGLELDADDRNACCEDCVAGGVDLTLLWTEMSHGLAGTLAPDADCQNGTREEA